MFNKYSNIANKYILKNLKHILSNLHSKLVFLIKFNIELRNSRKTDRTVL